MGILDVGVGFLFVTHCIDKTNIMDYNEVNGGANMATVSFRMDDTLKMQTEAVLEQLGLNMTTAMTMFAKTIVREQRLPLNLSIDPFYSPANQARLKRTIDRYESGDAVPIKKSLEELERMAEDA